MVSYEITKIYYSQTKNKTFFPNHDKQSSWFNYFPKNNPIGTRIRRLKFLKKIRINRIISSTLSPAVVLILNVKRHLIYLNSFQIYSDKLLPALKIRKRNINTLFKPPPEIVAPIERRNQQIIPDKSSCNTHTQ